MSDDYTNLRVEHGEDRVAVVTLNRPEVLNALSAALFAELIDFLDQASRDDRIRCVILTGSDRAFAAGADIREMADKAYSEVYLENYLADVDRAISAFRKPIIAAVSGHALGGGCELAMLCDFILASETASFGQPEIRLGISPGLGGSQRLTRAIGKAKAMEMILTGRTMGAEEAERAGLVSRVVGDGRLLEEARAVASQIARQSPLAILANKEMVNAAMETSLAEGLRFERRLFHSLFAFEDQSEGMAAFVEKRTPRFSGR